MQDDLKERLYPIRWWLFRRLVRRFMRERQFNRMIAVIAEEQRRCYYEDNYFDRMGQFDEAIELAVKP